MIFERIIFVSSYDSGYSKLPLFSNSPIKFDFETSLLDHIFTAPGIFYENFALPKVLGAPYRWLGW